MNCVETTELQQFLQGNLDPARIVAIDEHVGSCARCKAALQGLPVRVRAASDLGSTVLGVADCPEYEELSAFVDRLLDGGRAKSVAAHVNSCELCSRDVLRMEELRSHAALREPVTVSPGRAAARGPLGYWKRALAAVSAVAIVVAVAFAVSNRGPAPGRVAPVAQTKQPQIRVAHTPSGQLPKRPGGEVAALPKPETKTPTVSAPAYRPVLRDGAYRVIRSGGGKLDLARADGSTVRTALEARIAAAIAQKLGGGKVKPEEPVQMAMATMRVRDGNGYVPPPTAPKPIGPMGKIVVSDRPMFSWSKVDLAQSYHLMVTNKNGTLVIDEVTEKTSLTPTRRLGRGQVYSWQVGVRFNESDSWANSRAASFKMLSSRNLASIQRVKMRLPGSHVALGAAYELFGLYDQAAGEYRALRRANPDSQRARDFLTGVVAAGR